MATETENKSAASVLAEPPNADVVLSVNVFRPLPLLTDHSMHLVGGGPGHVTQPAGNKLKVKRDKAKLTFKVVAGDGGQYVPIDIAFREDADGPPVGYDSDDSPFEKVKVNGQKLEVTDSIQEMKTYKFSILVKRTSDNAIGMIDPFIENDN